ncbi:hypothetical protein ACEQ8H_004178 [Pleosporales sp. CAS-2024a]
MCFHNYSQHSGCGHLGESHTQPWELCNVAISKLHRLRGPMSPPLSPAPTSSALPKRSPSTRRFFSLSRSNTTASQRMSNSYLPATPCESTSSTATTGTATPATPATPTPPPPPPPPPAPPAAQLLDYSTLADHELKAVRCATPIERTHVSRQMAVCKNCARWLDDMRSMLARYDKTGSIRGTAAFEKFLKPQGGGGGHALLQATASSQPQQDDLTIPLDNCDDRGVALGARQAIVMGHPVHGMWHGAGGLEALEKELNERKLLEQGAKYR